MANLKQFRLPDVGEGLTEAEILTWHVAPGDTVRLNQIIVEIETAKAVVELPCPYAGVVAELLVQAGMSVDVGTPIITIELDSTADDERREVLVGYGPRAGAARRRQRRPAVAPVVPPVVASPPTASPVATSPATSSPAPPRPSALAKPPVRKLARELGIDLARVAGSGPGGIVTRDDLTTAASQNGHDGASTSRYGAEERLPIAGVRRSMASAMVSSAFTIPHVTEFVTVDASATMSEMYRLRALPEFDGVKVTPLLLVARALMRAVALHPGMNSRWDDAAGEIVVKHYINLGIAAATPRGLVVPNIKNADTLSLPDLARALSSLAHTARAGHTGVADMQGGTITITNVGVFGIDTGTPIINPGEAAILAFGAIREQPWVVDGQVVPRQLTTLALSFDHRVADGAQGSMFLRDIARFVEDPSAPDAAV